MAVSRVSRNALTAFAPVSRAVIASLNSIENALVMSPHRMAWRASRLCQDRSDAHRPDDRLAHRVAPD